jgi:hypothetical protein
MSPQADGPYSAAWRRYRLWSWAFWIVFVSYLPAMASLNRVLRPMRDSGNVIFFAALLWMVAFAVIGYQKSNFECPRCGELFFRKFDDRRWRRDWLHNPFARRCMHCGLPKWAARDPDPRPADASSASSTI